MQFATSVVLIAGTIIVFQQVNYMRNQSLGVNINQTLVVDGAQSLPDSLYQNVFQPFKTALLQLPGVKTCFFFYQRNGKRNLLDKWQ